MMRFTIAAGALLIIFTLGGCAGTPRTGREITVVCPVSGEEIGEPGRAQVAEYKGETYYFCCIRCKEDFEKDPERYLGK
jgi:YHS domain-containing protein